MQYVIVSINDKVVQPSVQHSLDGSPGTSFACLEKHPQEIINQAKSWNNCKKTAK